MKKIIAAISAAVLTAGLAACGDDNRHPAPLTVSRVCVNEITHVRALDSRCYGASPIYAWWYLTPGQYIPPINQRALAGSLTAPRGYTVATRALPTTGGTAGKAPTTSTPKKKPTSTKATPTKTKPTKAKSTPKPKSKSGSSSGGGSKRK